MDDSVNSPGLPKYNTAECLNRLDRLAITLSGAQCAMTKSFEEFRRFPNSLGNAEIDRHVRALAAQLNQMRGATFELSKMVKRHSNNIADRVAS